jgi:hypothetical protein
MNRHVTTEELSAFLDSELGLRAMQHTERHCAECPECGAKLAALRRVVGDLGTLRRIAPPPALRAQIRRQVAAEPRPRVYRWLDPFRFLFDLPLQPAWRSSAAVAFALVASAFLVGQGFQRSLFARFAGREAAEEKVTVSTYLGEAPLALQATTSEVDGIKFVWTEDGGWVQRGLEGEEPEALVDAASPRGRELLRRHSKLGLLLAEGDTVVLRYNLETVELRPTKQVGDPLSAPLRQRAHAVQLFDRNA